MTMVAAGEGGPDKSITKEETIDVDFAQWIVNNKDISKDERDGVKRLLKKRQNGNKCEIHYKLGKDAKHDDLGRWIALKGTGLQWLSRECRGALAQKFYWDIDIRNAQPTLLQQYAEKRGWKCDKLTHFNKHREDYISEMMEGLAVDRNEAKERVLRLMFGGQAVGLTSFFVEELQPELGMLMRNIYNENQSKYPFISKRLNATRSMMSFVLQTEERNCLMAMDSSLGRQGRSMDVLIHDGGLVKKKDGEVKFPEDILRKVERDVKTETGYDISLAVKPLGTTFERDEDELDNDEAYEALKTKWETTGYKDYTTFYLREQSCFVKVSQQIKDNILMKSRTDLLGDEENNHLPNGEPFVKRWFADASRKEYYKMDFLPGENVADHTYNLFRGFVIPPVAGDFSPFTELLFYISGKNERVAEYIEKWLASMFQRPRKKTGICIVVKGKKGVGKDTFFDGVGRIIGNKHFLTTAKPEMEVFGKFNSQLSQLLFLKFEEANFETNRDNEDQLKKLITSEHESIERKGHDPVRTTSCVNSVMTTNKHVPIPMSDDERRFMMVEASDDKKGDDAFWKRIHTALRDPAVLGAYHHHLMELDITDFEPTNVIRTAYYHDVLQTFAPYHSRYFQRLLEEEGDDRVEPFVWNARDLFLAMKGQNTRGHDLTEQRFGRDMRVYDTILTKNRKARGTEYVMTPAALEAFIKAKGWWIDY